jgi:hypothetical protein
MEVAGYPLWLIVYTTVMHFVSSAFVGLLAWWSMRTILRRGPEVVMFRRYSLPSALSLSFALFTSILVHVLVDWYTDWF